MLFFVYFAVHATFASVATDDSYSDNNKARSGSIVSVTGGGAFRFNELLKSSFEAKVVKFDEMLSVTTGLAFIARQSNQIYLHSLSDEQEQERTLYNLV